MITENGRAVGVEVQIEGSTNRVEGKRVTLCAGAFASPAILMRSGVGPRADLERHGISTLVDSSGVGANLIDHPFMVISAALSGDAIKQAPETDHSRLSVLLRYTAGGSTEVNDIQLYLTPLIDLTMWPGLPVPPEFPPQLRMACALQRPHSRGHVRLRSADPMEQPDIQLNYFDDHEDMRRMIDGLRLGWSLMHAADIASGWQAPIAGIDGQILDQPTVDSDAALADFISSHCVSICHPVGTAKMGPESDPEAVVDQYCCVRGVEGLRVVDASVMPNIVRANTNLTCIMIAERVVDWMRTEV